MDLTGKVALITGAASGFGEAIAHRYAKLGAKVVIVDLNEEKAMVVAASIGDKAIGVRADVTSRADIDAALKATTDAFGVPDIIVNNAGYTHKNQTPLKVDEGTGGRGRAG